MFDIPLGNRAKQTLGQYYMGLYFKQSFIPKKKLHTKKFLNNDSLSAMWRIVSLL